MSEYAQAVDLLEKSLSMQKEIGVKEIMLETISYLFLSYVKLGKDYDINEIKLLVIDEKKLQRETNKFEINFNLFQLLDDISYLNSAYNQVQEQADAMKNKLKYKFLNYPIPKQIIQEWERVS